MKNLNSTNLAGVQFYPHCFNIDVIGTGTADPEGVVFPGAYKPTDPSFRFQPFMTYGNDTSAGDAQNSKFVSLLRDYQIVRRVTKSSIGYTRTAEVCWQIRRTYRPNAYYYRDGCILT